MMRLARYLAALAVCMGFLISPVQAANVYFPLSYLQSSPASRVLVTLTPTNMPAIYAGRIILKDWTGLTTDTNGNLTVSNVAPIGIIVTAKSQLATTTFLINVPDTNGTVNAFTLFPTNQPVGFGYVLYQNGTATNLTIQGATAAGRVLTDVAGNGIGSWQPSTWITLGSDIYYTAGKVGIGTATPQYKLDVHADFTQRVGNDGIAEPVAELVKDSNGAGNDHIVFKFNCNTLDNPCVRIGDDPVSPPFLSALFKLDRITDPTHPVFVTAMDGVADGLTCDTGGNVWAHYTTGWFGNDGTILIYGRDNGDGGGSPITFKWNGSASNPNVTVEDGIGGLFSWGGKFTGDGSHVTAIDTNNVPGLVAALASKLTANQTITLSSDVTGSGSTAIAATVTNVHIPILSGTNGIKSYATNWAANFGAVNSLGITNSAVAPGVGGTNAIIANVKGTSGNIVFWNRTGANGVTICGQSVWTNTVTTTGADYVVGVNCGIAVDTGVGVKIQTRAF